jgi:DNA primase
MADQVDEVKQKTDIVSLISEYIDLKKAGRAFRALCPFHSEKTPSFMVSPELQIFKCFGCSDAGDVYAFLQKYEGMDFAEALKFLAERAGVELKPLVSGERSAEERLFQINTHAANFYHYLLTKHSIGKSALTYLTKGRGVAPETIKEFQLGFAPLRQQAIKSYLVDKKKYAIRDLERAGLTYTREGKVWDRFAGRVIFPLHDHRGNVTGFAGRILPGKEKSGLAKYINTPETAIYQKARMLYGLNLTRGDIKKERLAVVVEGELDMISSWQAGIKNVVAVKGSALTKEQVRLLRRFSEKVTLALDADIAGDAAARRGITIAEDAGLTVKVARMGRFKDPDEAARKDPVGFKKLLDNSVSVWDFIIDSVFSRHDAASGEGKAKISREIVPVLGSISDNIVQAHYIDLVAKRLSVPADAVAEQVAEEVAKTTAQKPKVEDLPKVKTKSRRELLEERLMAIAFGFDPKILDDSDTVSLVKTPLTKRILAEYVDFSKRGKVFNPSEFAAGLPKELVDGFAEMILADTKGLAEDMGAYKKELVLVVRELQILDIREQLGEIAREIRDFEEKRKMSKLQKAKEKFGELTRARTQLEGRAL